ncbi:PA14 domain-containing protein [Cesiribacter sp. SM1]|uniref:PKD domain-containing protein n=1 Tax=Cesiribacter sp. SM1 TaxID=2861196 RepID=UPI001CD2B7DB|nr:PA14 domain-containing protein [Cesiribacter sp. SM1]
MHTYTYSKIFRTFITCITLVLLTIISFTAQAQNCDCDFTISTSQSYMLAENYPQIKPGSTVCIEAGKRGRLKLIGFKGTKDQPIIFKNCGGQVVFENTTQEGTFIVENSRYFRVTGTGDSRFKYGFLLKTAPKGTAMGLSETDFEIDHVEIADAGFAGIMAKIEPNCNNTEYHRANFTMRNISIHDNYIHDTHGEGMYLGSSAYGGKSTPCGKLYPHVIEGLRVYNNRVENTGADGIQISSASKDVEVYNNEIYKYGQDPFNPVHVNGLMIGGGSTGKYYNNSIIDGAGLGICSFGIGDLYLFNNLVVRSGGEGIFIDERTALLPNSGNHVHNNTVIAPGKDCIKMQSRNSVGNTFYNNLLVAPGTLHLNYYTRSQYIHVIHSDIKYVQSNNSFVPTVKEAQFVDPASGNYRLQQSSPAIEKGRILSYFKHDYDGNARPQGNTFDNGAFEYSGSVRTDNQAPVVAAGNDQNITLPTSSLSLSGSASDPDGNIVSSSWTQLSGPSASISGANTLTLKLSNLVEGSYTFQLTATDNVGSSSSDEVQVTVKPQPASGEPVTANGLSYKFYSTSSGNPWKYLPDFSRLTPEKTGTVSNFSLSPKTQNNYFAFVFEGKILIDTEGTYTFYSRSDDGSQLFINGNMVVNNDGAHAAIEKSGTVQLEAGLHDIKVTYFEHISSETLVVQYEGPGIGKKPIPDTKLFTGSGENNNTTPADEPQAEEALNSDSTTDPEAPSNLNVSANAYMSSAGINWQDNSSNEKGFEIFMSVGNNSSYKQVGSTGSNKTGYGVGISKGNVYYFKIRAKIGTGHSAFSNEVRLDADVSSSSRVASADTLADAGSSQAQAFNQAAVYPNPATDWVNISFGDEFNGKVKVQLVNMTGEQKLSKTIQVAAGYPIKLSLNEKQLEPGLYIINISDGVNSKSLRLYKE